MKRGVAIPASVETRSPQREAMPSWNDPETGENAMPEMEDAKTSKSKANQITRRRFILGVIAGGAVVSAASYKILAPGRVRSFGGERLIALNVNGKMRRV
ncbi:MAG: hypothetical protein WB341_17190, partial [Terracidiphilus sp.]